MIPEKTEEVFGLEPMELAKPVDCRSTQLVANAKSAAALAHVLLYPKVGTKVVRERMALGKNGFNAAKRRAEKRIKTDYQFRRKVAEIVQYVYKQTQVERL